MFKNILWFSFALILVTSLACASKPSQTVSPLPPVISERTPATPQSSVMPASKEDWNKVVQIAKKEAKVTVYTSQAPDLRAEWAQAFKAAYNINVEFISGSPDFLAERIMSENRVGVPTADIFEIGVFTMEPLRKAGILSPLEIPEASNKSVWRTDPWAYDPNVFMHDMFSVPFAINTNLVKPADEPKSWLDLLEPKWKGKMNMYNPTRSGAGSKAFVSARYWLTNPDYWRQMSKQDITFVDDYRQQLDDLLRGKFMLSIGVLHTLVPTLAEAGGPIKWVMPKEGTGAKEGGIAIIRNTLHPNAAKVFVNWVISKEGMTILSRVGKIPVSRSDVPDDFLPQDYRWGPGLNLRIMTDQQRHNRAEDVALAREIFGLR